MTTTTKASPGAHLRPAANAWIAVCSAAICLLPGHPRPALGARPGARGHRPQHLIQAYDARTGFSQGDIWSPDLRYIASARFEEGSSLMVTVLDARSRLPLAKMDGVDGFVWVPGQPHRLAVAACGLYYKAFLGMWDGGHSWRGLHPVRRPDNECFRLHGVSADGRYIVYGYAPDLNASEGPPDTLLGRHIWLRLPAR
jgi:hypothetical protein